MGHASIVGVQDDLYGIDQYDQPGRIPMNTGCDASPAPARGSEPCLGEAGLLEQVQPGMHREEPLDVMIVHDLGRSSGLRDEHGVVHLVRRVSGRRFARPLEIAQAPPVCSVVAPVVGRGQERLSCVVGHEQRGTSRTQVREGRGEAVEQIGLGDHVGDRVVDEDDVERPSEPHRAHVAEDVLATGIEALAQRQHLRRDVGQRAGVVLAQVRGVVPATGTELEQRLRPGTRRLDERPVPSRLVDVVLGRGEEVEPARQVAVEVQVVVHGLSLAPPAQPCTAITPHQSRRRSRASRSRRAHRPGR